MDMDTLQSATTANRADVEAVTFTKWMVGEGPEMAGVVGGAVGKGAYTGKVLDFNPGPTTVIAAIYQLDGSERPFTALVTSSRRAYRPRSPALSPTAGQRATS
jgi:hypothetical protein